MCVKVGRTQVGIKERVRKSVRRAFVMGESTGEEEVVLVLGLLSGVDCFAERDFWYEREVDR